MSAVLESVHPETNPAIPVVHFIKGEVVTGSDVEYKQASGIRFTTPKLDINSLTWSRREQGPAFNVPVKEILDLLLGLAHAGSALLGREAHLLGGRIRLLRHLRIGLHRGGQLLHAGGGLLQVGRLLLGALGQGTAVTTQALPGMGHQGCVAADIGHHG